MEGGKSANGYQCLKHNRYSLMAVSRFHTSFRFISSCRAILSRADRPLKYFQKMGHVSATRSSQLLVSLRPPPGPLLPAAILAGSAAFLLLAGGWERRSRRRFPMAMRYRLSLPVGLRASRMM